MNIVSTSLFFVLAWLLVFWAVLLATGRQIMIRLMMAYLCVIIAALGACTKVFGGEYSRHERAYQTEWCAGKGKTEVVMPDGTRCDCLTDTHAIEFDFGKKWAESIGQSLNYSLQTGKRAGIVMVVKPSDNHFWLRLNSIIIHFNLPIDTWVIYEK